LAVAGEGIWVMYTDKVMDHFTNPRNVGEIEDADGIGMVGNPICGDVMKITIKVKDDKITDAKFKTFGCGAAIAVSSMVTEMVKGKSLEEAFEISNKAVADALGGLPPKKMHCSNLGKPLQLQQEPWNQIYNEQRCGKSKADIYDKGSQST
jgi:nitrogen fixation NifU-like protein